MSKKRPETRTSTALAQRKLQMHISNFKLWAKWLLPILTCLILYYNRQQGINYIHNSFIELSAELGFKLNTIVIRGHKNMEVKDVLAKLNADNNTPLFAINLAETKMIIEQNDWVKEVIVARILPNTLNIKIFERQPIALWQYNGQLLLIDEIGHAMKGDALKFKSLPHFVGEGANIYAANIIQTLKQKPELFKVIRHIIRLGNRRWDLILDNDITIKMPEDNFDQALDYINAQYLDGKFTSSEVKTLDLRDKHKYYIERR